MIKTKSLKNTKLFFLQYFLSFLIFLACPFSLQALTSEEGGFSISMPGTPKLQQVKHKSMVGNVKENTYTVKTATEEWSVSYTQLPKIATSMESDKALLSKAKQGFIKDTKAQELTFEKTKFAGKEARDFSFKIAPQNGESSKVGKARFLISGQKIYVIVGTVNEENSESAGSNKIEKYLNSFQLLYPTK